MKIKRLTTLLLIWPGVQSAGAQSLSVDEATIVKMALKESVPSQQIESQALASQLAERQLKDKYQLQFEALGSYSDSSEKSVAQFIPKFGPTHNLSLDLKKNSPLGLSYSIGTFANQQSTVSGSIDRATTTGVSLKLNVDLWKDLLGKTSKAQLANATLQKNKVKIESLLSLKNQEVEIRKLYWSMVANQESLKIAKSLMASAQKQLNQAIKRKKSSVSDSGEVARYQAQLATRESTVLSLTYQSEVLARGLKSQIPKLKSKKITLKPYNIQNTIKQVFQCTDQIRTYKNTPWDNTPIDELLAILDKSYEAQKQIQNRYSDVDIKLQSEFHMTGVEFNYDKSLENLSDDGRSGYSVGLSLSVPIGSHKRDTEKVALDFEHKRYLALKNQYSLRISSEHEQIIPLIELLENSARSQKMSSQSLEMSLASMKKKYRQARVDITTLINDQDALLNSLLQEVDTQLRTIHNLLDYFKTFSDTPCELNKLI